jgi:hypothetical protein
MKWKRRGHVSHLINYGTGTKLPTRARPTSASFNAIQLFKTRGKHGSVQNRLKKSCPMNEHMVGFTCKTSLNKDRVTRF